MESRRRFLWHVAAGACLRGVMGSIHAARLLAWTDGRAVVPKQIKAFCIDFNWVHLERQPGTPAVGDAPIVFAPPGHWADASPEEHVLWYEGLGANVIQTFAVSCNGYAWYKGGFVPPQAGLKYDFLPEVVNLAHKKSMLVMGYFCVGANTKWGLDHPDLSYGTPTTPHIPFTDGYLDYLSRSMADAMQKTGIDGYMIDWVWNPANHLRQKGWLAAEKKLYAQLTGKPFPESREPGKQEKLEYERRAIDRCWARIRQTRDRTNPDCILWLSVGNMGDPTIAGSKLLKECDWVMNESPNPKLYETGERMVGKQTRMIQNLVGWATHNAKAFLSDPKNRDLDLYGFAEPRDNSLPLPIADYLSKPVEAFGGNDRLSANDRNIAALARFYRGLPLDAVVPQKPNLTAEQVFEKSIEATGGRKALENLTSFVAKGTLEMVGMPVAGDIEVYAKAPNKRFIITAIQGYGDAKQGFDGQVAWTEDPLQGLSELSGEALAITRRESTFNAALKWHELYQKVDLKGKQKLRDREAYIVELTPADGKTVTQYYDADTFLLQRVDMESPTMQGLALVQTRLSDYRDIDGIKFPFTISQDLPTGEVVVKYSEVKLNVEIEDARFTKPPQ